MLKHFLTALAVSAVLTSTAFTEASVQYNLNVAFNHSGGLVNPPAVPVGPPLPYTWMDVRIYDSADSAFAYANPGALSDLELYAPLSSNEVLIFIGSHLTADANNYVNTVAFNFVDPVGAIGGLDTRLSISYVGSIGTGEPDFNIAPPTGSIDGSGQYDISLDFSGLANKFDGSDVLVLKATYTSAITDHSFSEKSTDGLYYVAAQINGIDPALTTKSVGYIGTGSELQSASGPVPHVPEPASLAIWGLGSLFGAVAVYRRKRRAS